MTTLDPTTSPPLPPLPASPEPFQIGNLLAEFGLGQLPECPLCGGELGSPPPEDCPHCGGPLEAHQALLDFAARLLTDAALEIAQGHSGSAALRLQIAKDIDQRAALVALALEAQAAEQQHEFAQAVLLYAEFGRLLDPQEPLYATVNQRLQELEERLRTEEGAKGYYNLALLRAKQGYWEEAEVLGKRAVELAPHLAKPWLLLHKLYLKLRRYAQAQYHLERYHALEPADPQVVALAQHLERDQGEERLRRLVQQIYWGFAWAFGILLFLVAVILLRAGTFPSK